MKPENSPTGRAAQTGGASLRSLTGIGKSLEGDLQLLGFQVADDLRGQDPLQMYLRLCTKTKSRQDPCVLDTFAAAVHQANTGEALPWWHFSRLRKTGKGISLPPGF